MSNKAKANDKYQHILAAAIRVFAERGFFQSTISQIAREAGIADGTIYLYFKNKEDMLTTFFMKKTKEVFRRFREEVDKADNSIDKLRFLIKRHLSEFQQSRDMAIVYQTETHMCKRIAEEEIVELNKMYLDIISEIIEQGQQEGAIRRDLYLGLVKRFIIGAVDEVINTWIHSDGGYDLASMADPLVDIFMKGIGTANINN